MYALHLAVSAIRSGDCDGAIVAAANWLSDPSMQIVLDKLGALSPTSRCHTFDASADGYARGEGFSALYLKKSDVALLDGLPIRAMIRGTAINANGKTGGITRPSARGQEDAIRKAYENAGGLPFGDTTFFECHGTGTQAGDPLEVAAVGNVFASSRRSEAPEDRLMIGSVKPNLGHTEGASAIASIMKVVLSLEAGEIAPTYGIEKLNPNIDFDGAKVLVVKDSAVPWPRDKVRRASVNSFGFGGANGHCIIDHVNEVIPGYVKPGIVTSISHTNGHRTNGYSNGSTATSNGHVNGNGSTRLPKHLPVKSQAVKKTTSATASTRQLVLLPFSAHNASSLQLNIDVLSHALVDSNRYSLADVAYTLGSKRSRLQQRTFRIVDTKQDNGIAEGLATEKRVFTSPIQTSSVAFVFTGQGAQWHAMGVQLFEYSVFRSTIAYLDYVLQELRQALDAVDPDPDARPSPTIAATLSGDCEPDLIQLPEVSQVVCISIQLALVDLLASWSVRPCAVVGHSAGEVAAAYASGHLTAAEAIAATFFRGRAVSRNKRKGTMLAVGLGADQIAPYLEGKDGQVCIAAMNSPGSVTLSGDVDAIDSIAAVLSKEDIFNRVVRTSGMAYHSHHMHPVGVEYLENFSRGAECLKKLGVADDGLRYPVVPWASSAMPDKVMARGVDLAGPHYWRHNLVSPVRFTQAVTKLMDLEGKPIDILLEIGPHAALKGPVEQILKSLGKPAQYMSALQRNVDARSTLLQLAGTLFAANAEIDLAAVNSVDADDARTGKPSYIHGCVAVDLPPYQYTYGPVSYYESRVSKDFRLREFVRHDLLGSEVPGASQLQPQWRNVLRTKDIPWLSDHRLLPDAVFPAAGYIALAVEAATRVYCKLPDALEITGYTFRQIDLNAVLRIPEDDYGIEVIVSMELVDRATAKEPAWAKFAVTSVARDSEEWTQHCTGLVKVEVSPPTEKVQMSDEMDPRFPSVRSWYDKFNDIGCGYGKTFQPLTDLQVDPHRNLAKATVSLNSSAGTVKGGESSYPLHPAALDATFQLAIIAFYGGQLESATAAFVPVHVSQLYLKAGVRQDVPAIAIAHGSKQGLRNANVQLQMADQSGDLFLEVDSMRFTEFRETKTHEMLSKQPFSSPFTRLVWNPDIRTLSDDQIRELFPPPAENANDAATLEFIEMISCLIAFEIYDAFVVGNDKVSPKGEIRHWLAWIQRIVEEDHDRAQVVEARKLPPAQRRELLNQLYAQVGERPEAQAAKLLYENAADILHERRTGIDVLISHKLLTPLYEVGTAIAGCHPQVSNVVDALAHANPSAHILEIGAGTGAATRAAMSVLMGANGIKRYADYTFTDISAGFLSSAKEMLSDHRDVKYSVLDIDQDPMTHGYEAVYDVVLACEAIHATESMDRTLAHCRSLLKPGGKLVLVETTRMRVLMSLLYGTLTGYWQSDNRTEGPYMSLEAWQDRLRGTGFSGVDLHVDDYEAPHNTTTVLVTTRIDDQEDAVNGGTVTKAAGQMNGLIHLLHDNDTAPALATQLTAELERRGATCKLVKFPTDGSVEEAVPANARVVAFLSGQTDFFDADAHTLKFFQYLAKNVKTMVWLTESGIVKGQDPRGAFTTGLLRAIATENPAGRFLSIDIEGDNFKGGNNSLVRNIVDKEFALQHESQDELSKGDESIDSEFAWQDGCLWVSRVVPDAGLGGYAEPIKMPSSQGLDVLPINGHGPVRAAFETAGIPNSLYFRSYTELLQPLPADYIDIKVAAVGLTSRDVTVAMGRSNTASRNLSSEYSGVVTKLGANVTGLSVGDRVYGIGKGNFGNYERVPAAFAQKLQSTDDLVEAATLPLSFMSAVYAFEHVARLRRGDKVLIQSATGGLGLAAIQVARIKGADVFAVADTAEKVLFLVDTVHIPRDHIFLLPDQELLHRASSATDKHGFKVILSTVAGGDALYQLLQVLAPMGHLIGVGGDGDAFGSKEARLGGRGLVQKNANFSSFDLLSILDNDPVLGRELIETVHNLHRTGQITPILPVSVLDVSELDQALLNFSKHTHIGKQIISFQTPESTVKILRQPREARFGPDACYIIAGGFGGLGRSIIRWMADRGAQDFVVLSRRGASAHAARVLLDDMKSRGVRVEAVACDVSKRDQVVQAIDRTSTTASNRPIRGVVNAVHSVSDLAFDELTIDQWRSGTVAKTKGSINLHEATLEHSLDFFVILTSTETVWTPATQAAYIAADNFATYFARYRRRLGLPASAISYGLVSDVGSDHRDISFNNGELYARNLAATLTEHQALMMLEPAFLKAGTEMGAEQGGWVGKRHDPLSAAGFFTCLSPSDLAGLPPTHAPRWHHDGRVALLMRAVSDAKQLALSSSDAGNDGDAGDAAGLGGAARLRRAFDEAIKAGPDGRAAVLELVTEGIAKAMAEMLFIEQSSVNPGKTVAEHGVDSLIAAELRNWFRQALATDLKNLLDSQTSIGELAEGIVDEALEGGE